MSLEGENPFSEADTEPTSRRAGFGGHGGCAVLGLPEGYTAAVEKSWYPF